MSAFWVEISGFNPGAFQMISASTGAVTPRELPVPTFPFQEREMRVHNALPALFTSTRTADGCRFLVAYSGRAVTAAELRDAIVKNYSYNKYLNNAPARQIDITPIPSGAGLGELYLQVSNFHLVENASYGVISDGGHCCSHMQAAHMIMAAAVKEPLERRIIYKARTVRQGMDPSVTAGSKNNKEILQSALDSIFRYSPPTPHILLYEDICIGWIGWK